MPAVSGTKKYALVVDGKFACEYRYPSIGTEEVERVTATLQSNPKVVITEDSPSNNVNTYNLLINEEVVGQIHYVENADIIPDPQMINAALQSDPTVVDITEIDLPSEPYNWTWDGTTFSEPV
jgi:hypothetical protein